MFKHILFTCATERKQKTKVKKFCSLCSLDVASADYEKITLMKLA